MIVVISLIAILVPVAVRCQTEQVSVGITDTLDPAPAWYAGSFRQSACIRAICGQQLTDSYIPGTRPYLLFAHDSCDLSPCQEIHLLAWLKRESTDSLLLESKPYCDRLALVLVRSVTGSQGGEWTLMTLVSQYLMGFGADSFVNVHSYWCLVGREAMRTFDSLPGNKEVYQTLEQWSPISGGFFSFDAETGKSTWRNSEFLFIDGDVREKTWEAVIGEKPTKFFPNGK